MGKAKEELAQDLRRYKARAERDAAVIADLREQIKGYEELMAINNGIVAAVLHAVGTIELPRDAVTKAMQELVVESGLDEERNVFVMRAVSRTKDESAVGVIEK